MSNSCDNVWMWHAVVTMTGCDKLQWQWLYVTTKLWWQWLDVTSCVDNDCMWQAVLQWLDVTSCGDNNWMWQAVVTMTGCDKLWYNDWMWQAAVTMTGCDKLWWQWLGNYTNTCVCNFTGQQILVMKVPSRSARQVFGFQPTTMNPLSSHFRASTMSNIWKTHLVVSLAPLMLHETYVDCE